MEQQQPDKAVGTAGRRRWRATLRRGAAAREENANAVLGQELRTLLQRLSSLSSVNEITFVRGVKQTGICVCLCVSVL